MDNKKLLIFGGAGLGVIILIVIIVTLLSGGKKGGPTLSGNDKITLNLWDPIDQPEVFKDIIKQYESENPNITVKYFKKPLLNYQEESTKASVAGNGPDIWAIPNNSILENVDSLSAAPSDLLTTDTKSRDTINDIVKNKYVPIVAQENIIKDKDGKAKLYGLPLFMDTLALYYNPTLLRTRTNYFYQNDIKFNEDSFISGPRTWNDLIDMVKEYTIVNNGTITQSAIALGRNDNVDNASDILALLMLQDGATMATPDGLTSAINLPSKTETGSDYYPGAQALDFFTSFADPSSPNYTWNQTFPSSYEAFKTGQTAMMIDYQKAGNDLRQENPTLSFRTWPMPQINGATTPTDFGKYWVLTVPKSGLERDNPKICETQNPLPLACEKTLAAWNFIKYLNTEAGSTYTSNVGLTSALKSTSIPQTVYDRQNYGSAFSFQKQSAVPWYVGKDPDKVEAEFNNMINNVVNLHVDSKTAVNTSANEISNIFRNRAGFNTTPSPTNQNVGLSE